VAYSVFPASRESTDQWQQVCENPLTINA